MDPTTVVITLSANLTFSGGLYYLIGRNMPPRSGLGLWSAAAIIFGLAYFARLLEGLWAATPLSPLFDVAMIASALLFVGGMLQFVGRPVGHRRWFSMLLGLYVGALVFAVASGSLQARYALLNGALGALWSTLSLIAGEHALRGRERSLRTPLTMTAGLLGVLGVLTMLRGVAVVREGIGSMYGTLQSEIYYGYASLAVVLLALALLWMVFVRLHAQLVELASRDALTRLLNRNGLDDAMKRHFGARNAPPVSLLQVDIDHFKGINDAFGHATGDVVLRVVAGALAGQVRGGDFVARVGGEEFVVGCASDDAGTATRLAERVRLAIDGLRLRSADGRDEVRCTVSVGLSRQFRRLTDWEAAWREADDALYAAKSAGRNQVMVFEPRPV